MGTDGGLVLQWKDRYQVPPVLEGRFAWVYSAGSCLWRARAALRSWSCCVADLISCQWAEEASECSGGAVTRSLVVDGESVSTLEEGSKAREAWWKAESPAGGGVGLEAVLETALTPFAVYVSTGPRLGQRRPV